MAVTVEDLEKQALGLPEKARAELVGRLLRSFEDRTELDQESAQAWLDEASSRDAEMDESKDPGVPAEQVFEELRSREG